MPVRRSDTQARGLCVIFTPTNFAGVWIVESDPHTDERGSFARAFCAREFEARGMNPRIAQVNLSRNRIAGTVRGMHFQRSPHEETKLVRVTRGTIFDVVVDLRTDSPTYMQWLGVELSEEASRSLYIPGGLAHGF